MTNTQANMRDSSKINNLFEYCQGSRGMKSETTRSNQSSFDLHAQIPQCYLFVKWAGEKLSYYLSLKNIFQISQKETVRARLQKMPKLLLKNILRAAKFMQ
jgi:hypothetical protein